MRPEITNEVHTCRGTTAVPLQIGEQSEEEDEDEE